jgi:hypothetical protein
MFLLEQQSDLNDMLEMPMALEEFYHMNLENIVMGLNFSYFCDFDSPRAILYLSYQHVVTLASNCLTIPIDNINYCAILEN